MKLQLFPDISKLFINYFKLNKSFAATAAAFYDLDIVHLTPPLPPS
jgi:hypothetical protein